MAENTTDGVAEAERFPERAFAYDDGAWFVKPFSDDKPQIDYQEYVRADVVERLRAALQKYVSECFSCGGSAADTCNPCWRCKPAREALPGVPDRGEKS